MQRSRAMILTSPTRTQQLALPLPRFFSDDWSYDGNHIYYKVNGIQVQAGVPATFGGSQGGLFIGDGAGNLTFDPNGDFDFLGAGESLTTSIEYTILASNGDESTASVNVVCQRH